MHSFQWTSDWLLTRLAGCACDKEIEFQTNKLQHHTHTQYTMYFDFFPHFVLNVLCNYYSNRCDSQMTNAFEDLSSKNRPAHSHTRTQVQQN